MSRQQKTSTHRTGRRVTRNLPARSVKTAKSIKGGQTVGGMQIALGDGSVRLGDGSVRFVSDGISLNTW